MMYCPRCDKPITPDHRCLSRRHFFGMLAAAAGALGLQAYAPIAPITELWAVPITLSVAIPPAPGIVVVSTQLYRIPIQFYRGGALRIYEAPR